MSSLTFGRLRSAELVRLRLAPHCGTSAHVPFCLIAASGLGRFLFLSCCSSFSSFLWPYALLLFCPSLPYTLRISPWPSIARLLFLLWSSQFSVPFFSPLSGSSPQLVCLSSPHLLSRCLFLSFSPLRPAQPRLFSFLLSSLLFSSLLALPRSFPHLTSTLSLF